MQSSRLLRQPARQLGSLGSALSRYPACYSSTRAFHASATRRSQGLDTLLHVPHELMNLLHANVPWYAAIPLTAFIVRGALVTTAGAYARSLMARYVGLHPLRQALGTQKLDEVLKRGNFRTPKEATLQVKTEVKELTRSLDKQWKVDTVGQSLWWTMVQLPIFFIMADTIRQKCGARDGLLGLGVSLYDKTRDGVVAMKDSFSGTTAASEHGMSEMDRLDSGIVDYIDNLTINPAPDAGELVAVSASNMSELAGSHSQWYETSLATEGMLWFPDLLLPDPTGILPFIVSGLMFGNIYFTKNNAPAGANWQNVLRKLLLTVSLLVGPICQDLPAALMLYWASSTSSVIVWNWYLDWRYPAPNGFTACRRPLLMPPTPMQTPKQTPKQTPQSRRT